VELLALKKDKQKKGWRLNLYSKESSSVKIYSLSKVVNAREYIVEKDTKE
jgi:alpha-L-arabinofuranosidase